MSTGINRTQHTADPTTGDDSDDGYVVGSIWVRTDTGDVWICEDTTVGSAVWQRLNNDAFGFTLIYGGDMDTAGNYNKANGDSTAADVAALTPLSEHVSPIDGTIEQLNYNTRLGDATSTCKLVVNSVVQHTFTLDASGIGNETGIGHAVSAGDRIAIEYDAGQAPDTSIWTVSINPANT